MAIAPVAAQVGLQLVLQPYGNTVGALACTGVGVAWPAYASFKAVETLRLRGEAGEAARWLTYWGVWGLLSAAERAADRAVAWVPYYTTLKLAFLVWLQHPRYAGAARVSNEFVRPLLRRVYPAVDDAAAAAAAALRRPELDACVDALNDLLSRVPVLEWFVRGPDGRPRPPRPPPPRGFIAGSLAPRD